MKFPIAPPRSIDSAMFIGLLNLLEYLTKVIVMATITKVVVIIKKRFSYFVKYQRLHHSFPHTQIGRSF